MPPAYLGLLFLDGTLRGRAPVALGRCFHCIVFVVVLQRWKKEIKRRGLTIRSFQTVERKKPQWSCYAVLLVWVWRVTAASGWGRPSAFGSWSCRPQRAEVWQWRWACGRCDPLGRRGRGWWERRGGGGNHGVTRTWGRGRTQSHVIRSEIILVSKGRVWID